MFSDFNIWFNENNISDYLSFIGLIITVIGFFVTIYNVIKTRNATKEAKRVVEQVRNDLKWTDAVTTLVSAIATMDEIKRLQRMNAWEILPDRYSNLRKALITIRSTNPDFSEEELALFQGAISQFSTFERTIEESLPNNTDKLNAAKINGVLSNQIDKIQEILVIQKKKIGRNL